MIEGDDEGQSRAGEEHAKAVEDWLNQLMRQEAMLLGGAAEALRAAAEKVNALEVDPDKLAEIQARNLAAFEQATTQSGRQAIELFRSGLNRLRAELAETSTPVAEQAQAPRQASEQQGANQPPRRYAANMTQELSTDLAQLRRDSLLASLRDASRRLSELAGETGADQRPESTASPPEIQPHTPPAATNGDAG